MINIPIYRAKKIDSDEYVEGLLLKDFNSAKHDRFRFYIQYEAFDGKELHKTEIDQSTLSIHFPDLIASDSDRLLPNGEKDLRIFASLSEFGKGGDILGINGRDEVITYDEGTIGTYMFRFEDIKDMKKCKIIGIQQ